MVKHSKRSRHRLLPQTKAYRRKKHVLFLCVVLIILMAFTTGGVYARYVHGNNRTGAVQAKDFYFTSDHLSGLDNPKTHTLNPNVTAVSFTLRNHADSLRFSSDDIHYTLTLTGDAGASLDITAGTLKSGKADTATITLSGLKSGGSYTVTAQGTAGYKETLQATFNVTESVNGVYKHLDVSNSAYVLLTVWTENVTGEANIRYPANLIPDNTDPIMSDEQNYIAGTGYTSDTITDSTSFSSNAYSSQTYRFFKAGDGSFTADNFTITVNGNTATTKEPK